jgi:hypothetical protein
MSAKNLTIRSTYVHPDDPANHIKPGEAFIVDGLDWSWAFCIFRPIEGYPGYCVGSNGTVWSCLDKGHGYSSRWEISETWRQLKASPGSVYARVCLGREGKYYPRLIHHLVLEAFVGPRPHRLDGCHYDDDKGNNRFWNLRWDSRRGNFKDAMRNGRVRQGSRVNLAKLTEAQVLEIREAYAQPGASFSSISRLFDVTPDMISVIIKGLHWKHVGGPLDRENKKPRKLDHDKADRIRDMVASGMSRVNAAREFGVDARTVSGVVLGQIWKRKP